MSSGNHEALSSTVARYLRALESNDLDTQLEIWKLAEEDPRLESGLREAIERVELPPGLAAVMGTIHDWQVEVGQFVGRILASPEFRQKLLTYAHSIFPGLADDQISHAVSEILQAVARRAAGMKRAVGLSREHLSARLMSLAADVVTECREELERACLALEAIDRLPERQQQAVGLHPSLNPGPAADRAAPPSPAQPPAPRAEPTRKGPMNPQTAPPLAPENPIVRRCLEVALSSQEFRRAVDNLVRRRSLPHETTDEVVQVVACRALERAEEYDPARSPRAWLMGFVTNVLHERRRFHRGQPRQESSFSEDQWAAILATLQTEPRDREGPSEVWEALRGIPERRQRAIRLRILEGLPYPRVAEELNTTVACARALVCRGLNDLRRHLPPENV